MKTCYQTPLIPKRYYAGEESYIYHNLTFYAKETFQCLWCDPINVRIPVVTTVCMLQNKSRATLYDVVQQTRHRTGFGLVGL
jgi:hypothetical protein